ncbi:hypothetical protein [Guyparkeria sp.]|uniref:hypothetical protein n=1 Tax=Guyparkeria sp. TaxID=2035736 RepID=UPI00397103D7
MRHIYASRITYLLAAMIIAAAVLFAWLRSQEHVVVSEGTEARTHPGPRVMNLL